MNYKKSVNGPECHMLDHSTLRTCTDENGKSLSPGDWLSIINTPHRRGFVTNKTTNFSFNS
ncbi:hypothetical protein NT6N_15320 [Oceaniferula spumae]|uniref:Uncharacterized protein n=1 Tax=Oceaniferula spumae TaxID=2979115 RepID=A0AAT9FKL7_9BACT